MKRPVLRPQYEQRALNFFVEVRLIVLEVNRGCRAIVLANGVDRIRVPKRPQIFPKYGGTDPVGQWVGDLASAKPQQGAFQKIPGAVLTRVSGNGAG